MNATATAPFIGIKPHIVSREFDAPRDLVWKVNTEAEHLQQWLSPAGRTAFYKTMDFRVGGTFHYGNHSDDGQETIWGKIIYQEITPKDRVVFLQSFSDENGGVSTHPLAPTWPKVMYAVITFEDLGKSRTRLTVSWTPAETSSPEELATFDSARAGMDQGWKGTLDKLEVYLASL